MIEVTDQSTVLLAGDTHGNTSHIRYLHDMADREGCEYIFQVGDFGCLDYEDSPLALVVKKSQASRAGGALELSGGIADDTMDTRDWEDMLLRYLESAGFPDPQDTPRWYAVPIYG